MQRLILLILCAVVWCVEAEPLPELVPAQSIAQPQYDLVYSVQVATYVYASYGQSIASQYAEIPFLCRQRNNGLFGLYYGVFQSYADAKMHLRDYALFSDLNAYVVKLVNVSFQPCDNLGTTIQQSKKEAFSQRECADCNLQELIEEFLPQSVFYISQ